MRQRIRLLGRLRNVLPIDDLAIVASDRKGEFDLTKLPTTVTLSADDVAALKAGQAVSGTTGKVAFAVAPGTGPRGRQFLVATTQRIDTALGATVRLFLWASLATILLAVAAATMLGRWLARPIRDVSAATHAIADGQLSTRVEDPPVGRTDEVADLQRSINRMAGNLERSRALEQQFLLSVSHDLRTPLTSIGGYAEAIADGTIEPTRAAGVIRSESRRLERLVADLLDLAKLQSKSFTFVVTDVDLSAAVHTATDGAAGGVDAIAFQPVTTGPVVVRADPDRLAQVLANLVENAGKYARQNVIVSSRVEHGRGVVTVDDDGPGISPHDLPHVFERLYRARHAPERRENSSGLGLAIVKELVEGMGGQVAAGEVPTGGARLSFWLPVTTSGSDNRS
jgi:two-component system sensor histidine kinase BaeS